MSAQLLSLHRLQQLFLGMLFALFLPLAAISHAQNVDILSRTGNSLSTNTLGIASSPNFLPVNEAYQFAAHLDETGLKLSWQIAEGYYLYQERFYARQGQTLLAPTYSDAILKYDELFERETLLHFKQAELHLTPEALKGGERISIEYQGCAEAGLCYPPETRHLTLNYGANSVSIDTQPLAPATTPATPYTTDMSFWAAITLAFLGGLILNIMPCVFPVLSIKVLQLTQAQDHKLALHGSAYTFGVLATFGLLGALLIALKASGAAMGWGFQLQSPPVVAGLFFLFIIMGLSLSGFIQLGNSLMSTGDSLTRGKGLSASFFTGVLAVVVASPCTAPFMGTAIGYAFTQPATTTLSVFLALGFGMALPMLVLCLFPQWLKLLPKPGAWMETIKELLAFPLYLSAIWLLWVYGRQTDMSAAATLLATALGIIFLFWAGNRLSRSTGNTLAISALALLLAATASIQHQQPLAKTAINQGIWETYTPERLSALRAKGTPVLVNLTADWCITCLANEKAAFDTQETATRFKEAGIVALKGDWTQSDSKITELLNEYGRSGVPLYLWFPANHSGNAIILPQILSKKILYQSLNLNL